MKFHELKGCMVRRMKSHPARGAWIEITPADFVSIGLSRRTPHGVRGLKFKRVYSVWKVLLVAPRTGCVD